MEDQEQIYSHYWPGEGCIPITPQAVRYGYVFPVYVTQAVWAPCITWTYTTKRKEVNADLRIYALLESCYNGMGKALATEPDRVMYPFKHYFWERDRPKAKKMTKRRLGARLLLDPETEEPWLLIFDPEEDGEEVLKRGDTEENRGDVEPPGIVEPIDYTALDQGGSDNAG